MEQHPSNNQADNASPMDFWNAPVPWTDFGLDPVALELGRFALRWYSLAYIVGLLFAWVMIAQMLRRRSHPPMTSRQLDDLVLWATLGVIVGGRLIYVLVYDFAGFLADPLSVLRLWEGGMSFHGGLVGVLLGFVLFARRHGLEALRLLDYAAVVAPMGLFLGRLANFVNAELWGRPTNGSWGVIFPGAGPEPRHPSQLYEAGLEGLLLLVLLTLLFWRTAARLRPGLLGGIFALGYGSARFFVEWFREPDPQLGLLALGFSMGQWLSLPLVLLGLVLILRAQRRPALA